MHGVAADRDVGGPKKHPLLSSTACHRSVHDVEEINDYICVGQTNSEGDVRAVLFVKLRDGLTFTSALRDKIAEKIDDVLWRDLVPEVILDVKDIPKNPEGSELANDAKLIANLALPPRFRQVLIESPL
ncbi:acetoacetyl-CoA synthetase [Trichonephila clavipes]|nr:acetoacetyl-CoA synthetase [Trichonephila clavipes]